MNNRLEKIAGHIENGKGFIDVGTDHGFIPSVLARCGYSGNIYAADLREKPLESARQTAKRLGVSDKIEFILCDGLDKCPFDKIDTVIIAGMGGDNICGILDRAVGRIGSGTRLILQPMKKAEILRYWLINNGFSIENEDLADDAGVVYQIITARSGSGQTLKDAELFVGKYELISENPLFGRSLDMQMRRIGKTLKGLTNTALPQYESKIKLAGLIDSQLTEMKK